MPIIIKLISIFLLTALILQTGFKILIYLDYEVNKESITVKYCENKSKPKMKCHGKCHLMKKMDEAEKKQNPSATKEKSETFFLITSANKYLLNFLPGSSNAFISLVLNKILSPVFSIFHPPCNSLHQAD